MARTKHAGGRPPKFKTPEEMQQAIDEYFQKCDDGTREIVRHGHKIKVSAPEPYTMTGLAIALGFESRHSLVDYNEKSEFSPTIKKARIRVEESVERLMLTSNGVVAGIIFNAKNNFGWVDKKEIDHTTKGESVNPYASLTTEELRKLAQGR